MSSASFASKKHVGGGARAHVFGMFEKLSFKASAVWGQNEPDHEPLGSLSILFQKAGQSDPQDRAPGA